MRSATGILIFPKIVKAGFIFGAQGSKGVLQIGGRSRSHYTIAAASFGLQAGVEWFSYVLFFMDRSALRYLDQSDGWTLGTVVRRNTYAPPQPNIRFDQHIAPFVDLQNLTGC